MRLAFPRLEQRIYLVGAQSSGKTTMVDHIVKRYHLDRIPEIARSVMVEMNCDFRTIRVNVELAARYQREVFQRQLLAEQAQTRSYVSDRAFDNLAYAAEHTLDLSKIIATEPVQEYFDHVRDGVVFFTRPARELLHDDGVRIDANWESVLRIDGMVKLLLEQAGIEYVPLSMSSMQERVRLVNYILDRVLGLRP